jgi:light-regulated signal transduction histidine kinase (bacteriophytochrome)
MRTGKYRWHLSRAFPVKDASGKVLKWYGTATDIHDQKLMTRRLEELVRERTAELQRSNEDLQQFAHVASHDLKEPLRKVRIFTEFFERSVHGKLSEESRAFLEKVKAATDRMAAMINGVLNYSSLNAADQPIETVDLNEVFRNIASDLEIAIQQKGARITYGALPSLRGAPVLIYQLFYNLVNNAIKFAKDTKAPLISISATRLMKNGMPYVSLQLQDNGIGFSQEYADKIFNTFTRLNPKDRYEGTGLGLALCRKIAERHGGTITATGTEGVGATFTVVLPAGL